MVNAQFFRKDLKPDYIDGFNDANVMHPDIQWGRYASSDNYADGVRAGKKEFGNNATTSSEVHTLKDYNDGFHHANGTDTPVDWLRYGSSDDYAKGVRAGKEDFGDSIVWETAQQTALRQFITVTSGFEIADRYKFDFSICSSGNGWVQIDTAQSASYCGEWLHPYKLLYFSYTEGDTNLCTADNDDDFARYVHYLAFWNEDRGFGFKIDCLSSGGLDVNVMKLKELGLGKYLH